MEKYDAYCWFVATEFADGSLGHLDLTLAVRMGWHEGFHTPALRLACEWLPVNLEGTQIVIDERVKRRGLGHHPYVQGPKVDR